MYVPAHFKPDDEAVRELLANVGAADLITATADGILATLLPMVLDASGSRRARRLGSAAMGHVARNNAQWKDAGDRRRAGHRPRPGRLHLARLVRHEAGTRSGRANLELRHALTSTAGS